MFIYKMNGYLYKCNEESLWYSAMLHGSLESMSFFFFFFLALLALNWVLPKSVNQILLVLMFNKIGDLILFGITPLFLLWCLRLECNRCTFNGVEHSQFCAHCML